MKSKYGVDSMPETAENVAEEYHVGRAGSGCVCDADAAALGAGACGGIFQCEIVAVPVAQAKGDAKIFDTDEQPRPDTTMEGLQKLKPIVKPGRDGDGGECFGD